MNNNLGQGLKKQPDISKYQNVEGFDLRKLSFGLWWIKHRDGLKLALIIVLATISFLTLAYTIFTWTKYYLVFKAQDEQMIRELVLSGTVSESFLKERAPKDIIVSSLAVASAEGKYDLYVSLQNINQDYYGLISYCFVFNANQSDCGETFILPDDKKYIFSLKNDLGGFPRNASFRVEGVSWSRISKHEISNWQDFYQDHLNFSVADISFAVGEKNELSEKLNINLLTFTIKNNTAYDYYEVPLNILLLSRGRIVGVNRYVLKDFDSNQEENVKIVWPGTFDAVSTVEVRPDLDISRDDIYQN